MSKIRKFQTPSSPVEYVGMPKEEFDWMNHMFWSDPNDPKYKWFLQYAKDKYGRLGDTRLPEVIVEAKHPEKTLAENAKENIEEVKLKWNNLPTDSKVDLALTGAGFIPGLDVAADIADLGRSVKNGKWGNAAFAAVGLGLPISGLVLKSGIKSINKTIQSIPLLSLSYNKINPKILKEILELLYRNFLKTINGDNYYRLVPQYKLNYKVTNPDETLFVSHTTPWEEFSNSTYDLFEFPTETFGVRKATNYKGIPGNIDVTEMGKNHLLYGRYSSGKRGLVPLNSLLLLNQNYQIKHGNIESIYDNIVDRPLNGSFYDHNPNYEDIFFGNQTTITTEEWNDALSKPYVKYTLTPNGVLKILHIQKQGGRLIPKHNKGNKVVEMFGIDTSKFTKNQNSTRLDSKKVTNPNEWRNKLTKKKHASYINSLFVNARPIPGSTTVPRKKIIESEYKNS